MNRFTLRETFPLCQRPAGVAFLDDDADYLRIVQMLQPEHQFTKFYLSPRKCIADFNREIARFASDFRSQQDMIATVSEGAGIVRSIIDYWQTAHERYDMMHVLLVDFAMPAMTGLEVLANISEWKGCRVLLTGQADEHLAVDAFNSGFIDQFVPKQSPDVGVQISDVVKRMLASCHERRDQLWRTTFSPENLDILERPSTAAALRDFAEKQWVEYISIGAPFGILGYDAQGTVSWLQLETDATLPGLAEMVETLQPSGDWGTISKEVAAGKLIVNAELACELFGDGKCVARPAFQIGNDGLHAALFDLGSDIGPSGDLSYNHWLKTKAVHGVPD